jgi:hypothetical protein
MGNVVRTRVRFFLCGLVVVLSAFHAVSADAQDLRACVGEWRLADRDAEARIDQAVARVTNQMDFFVRAIAHGQIDNAVNPETRVMIDADGPDHVVVAVGRSRPIRLRLNGPAIQTTSSDGRRVSTRATWGGGVLTLHERTDQGVRLLHFRPRGEQLVVSTRIQSERLPADIVYSLHYGSARPVQLARR